MNHVIQLSGSVSELAKELVLKISEDIPHVGSNPTASASIDKKRGYDYPLFSFVNEMGFF